MNKLISKIVGVCLGLSLATGVGVGVAVGQNNIQEAKAAEEVISFNYASLKSVASGNYADAGDYLKTPATAGNTATFTLNLGDTFTPTSDIVVTLNLATFGSGNNPSSSNTNVAAQGGASNVWTGSGLDKYPSSSTYLDCNLTLSKPNGSNPLSSLSLSISVNSGVKILRFKSASVNFTIDGGGTPTSVTLGSGTIEFGNNKTKINAATVTGTDDLANEWTIETAGTSSFTPSTNYCQIGSGNAPATSIIFSLDFGKELNVSNVSIRLGGFSGTAGSVTIKAGVTSIGTGNLNGSNDLTISSNTSAKGTGLYISIASISKGVKVYYISYTISESGSEDVRVESLSLGSDISLAKGQTHELVPTITPSNATNKSVSFVSGNTQVASVSEQGIITAVAIGTTTITCTSVDNSSATDSIQVQVTKAVPKTFGRFSASNKFEIGETLASHFTSTKNILRVTYTDSTTEDISIADSRLTIKLGDVVITSSYVMLASDNAKTINIAYTDSDASLSLNINNIVVTESLAFDVIENKFANNADYLIVGDTTSYISVSYVSLGGQPTANAVSSKISNISTTISESTYSSSAFTGSFKVVLNAAAVGMASITISLTIGEKEINYSVGPIVVRDSGSSSGEAHYEKVTSNSDLVDGQYLIINETESVAFDGSLSTLDAANNLIDVVISNSIIECTSETQASEFTIDMTAGSIKSASGYYIGRTTNSNGLNSSTTEAYENTISISGGDAVIACSSGPTLRYNSSDARFRFYKTGQSAIQLYKHVEETEASDFDKALEFVNTFMHTEISVSDKGTGACITSGWYTAAKAAFLNTSGSTATGYLQSAAQRAIVADSFSDYFARLQAWAAANDEEFELSNGDYIVVSASNRIFPTFSGESDAAIPAIVVVIALATVTTGAYFFLRKKKEN